MRGETADAARSSVSSLRDTVRYLLGAERRLRRRFQGAAGELSYPQLLTVAAAARHPGATASEIAKVAGLDPGSLTAVLGQLESLGAIERTRNPANRRAYVITLSARGQELAAPWLSSWVARWDERLAGFSDEELMTATKVMSAIAAVFDSVPGSAHTT